MLLCTWHQSEHLANINVFVFYQWPYDRVITIIPILSMRKLKVIYIIQEFGCSRKWRQEYQQQNPYSEPEICKLDLGSNLAHLCLARELLLNSQKEKKKIKDVQYFLSHESYAKFKCKCPQIKFYYSTAVLIIYSPCLFSYYSGRVEWL